MHNKLENQDLDLDNVAEENPPQLTFCVPIDKGALTPAPQTGSMVHYNWSTEINGPEGDKGIDAAELVSEDQENGDDKEDDTLDTEGMCKVCAEVLWEWVPKREKAEQRGTSECSQEPGTHRTEGLASAWSLHPHGMPVLSEQKQSEKQNSLSEPSILYTLYTYEAGLCTIYVATKCSLLKFMSST